MMYIFGSGFIGKSIKSEFINSELISLTKRKKLNSLNKYKTAIVCCGVSRLVKNDYSIIETELKKIYWVINKIQNSKINKIILFSTIDLYDNKKKIIRETDNVSVKDYYTLTQSLYENVFKLKFKSNLIILRLTGVYGEIDNGNSAISKMIHDSLNKKKIVLNENKDLFRDYIYIDDLLEILNILINKKFVGLLNVASFKSRTIYEYAKIISKHTNSKIVVDKNLPIARSYDVKISGSKLNRVIGEKTKSIDENILRMINHIRTKLKK